MVPKWIRDDIGLDIPHERSVLVNKISQAAYGRVPWSVKVLVNAPTEELKTSVMVTSLVER